MLFFYHFFKWLVAPQLWNWYHQQRKYNSFLLVGGTVKRLVKLESLRMPFENQILTPWDVYEWADENIENKIFLFRRRTLLHIPQSIRTGWLLQKQLMTQEVIIVFDQLVKQSLSYIPSPGEIFVVKNLHASNGLFVDIDCLKISHCGSSLWGSKRLVS